ncbi:uncharacterized protein LOC111627838 [Centruroides sculpturatus]|uniref:uncharacterized protein LOC111627838 n=1 Tax=Centruroides sculpturatus TaxID=218467 RepID=UPI000C6E33DE|nr:uncharacterized protein LOC111627838 [Centruroides sculpturatus]
MINLTKKCNFIMFALTVVLILLISSVASQRRWAGTYPTEPPLETGVNKQCNCDKSDFEEGKQFSPKNPDYAKGDIGRDEDDKEGGDRIRWEPPEISDIRRDNERKDPNSRIDVARRIEVTSSERGGPVLTMIQKPPEERRPNDRSDSRNIRKDAYPSTGTRRNDNPIHASRGTFSQSRLKGTASRDQSSGVQGHDIREDSFRNYQPKRGDELPKSGRDSTAIRGTRLTTSRPTESNIRINPEIREDYIPKSDRNDDKILVDNQNFTKDSRFENGRKDLDRSNERSNVKPPIQSEEGRKDATSRNSRTNPTNYRPSGGSNVNNRATVRPLSTNRSYGVTQFEDNIRKEDRSAIGSSRKNEDESKILKNQNNPTRIHARPYPVTARTFPPNRFPQRDSPRIIEDRKIVAGDRNTNRKVGFLPDSSHEIIVFPKDDDDDDDDSSDDEYEETKYSQSNRRSFRNNQRDRTRNKRDIDLHEDVEFIPGFEFSNNRRKEVLKHYDEVDETDVEVFSLKAIEIKKSS